MAFRPIGKANLKRKPRSEQDVKYKRKEENVFCLHSKKGQINHVINRFSRNL